MARCQHCDYPVPDDRERVGARCPSCHDPLYEPAGRFSRQTRHEEEASCVAHPGMESVGFCARCNNYVCETCRTRWRGMILCAACVDRALAGGEGAPSEVRAAVRQGRRALLFSLSAWLLAALALLGQSYAVSVGEKPTAVVGTFLAVLVLAANVLLAGVGMGQALAVLRGGGSSREGGNALALTGLVLGGLYAGVLLGIGTMGLWRN